MDGPPQRTAATQQDEITYPQPTDGAPASESPSEAPSIVALEHQEPQVAQPLRSHVHRATPTTAHPAR